MSPTFSERLNEPTPVTTGSGGMVPGWRNPVLTLKHVKSGSPSMKAKRRRDIFQRSRGITALEEALGSGKGTMPDPQFKDLHGNHNTLDSWILDATSRVETS